MSPLSLSLCGCTCLSIESVAYLLLLDWLENLDDTSLVILNIYSLKHLGILSSAYFSNYFIVVLTPVLHNVGEMREGRYERR